MFCFCIRSALSRICCTSAATRYGMKRCGFGGTVSVRCSLGKSESVGIWRCGREVCAGTWKKLAAQNLSEQICLWRAHDHEGEGQREFASWMSAAFESLGIRNCRWYNKINSLHPKEGPPAVAFPSLPHNALIMNDLPRRDLSRNSRALCGAK